MRLSRELADLLPAAALSALLFATGVLVPARSATPAGFLVVAAPARSGSPPGTGCPARTASAGLLAAAALLPVLPPPVTLIFAVEHALPAAWYLGWRARPRQGDCRRSAVAAVVVTALLIGGALPARRGRRAGPRRAPRGAAARGLRRDSAGARAGGQPARAAPTLRQFEEILALLRRVLPAVTLIGIFLECAVNTPARAARVLTARRPGLPRAGPDAPSRCRSG